MTRLINVSDDVYETLTRMKGKESYSVIIRGLLEEKSNKTKILSFFGKGGVDKEKVNELEKGWSTWSRKFV